MTLSKPSRAWIFDVDGVLTNPEAKQVLRLEIFDELIKRLRKQELIGFNTGRSADFLLNEILEPLYLRCPARSLLRNCFAIAEKGAIIIAHDEKGERDIAVGKQMQFPSTLRNEIKNLVTRPPFSETMFIDETKRTMISVEMKKNTPLLRFKEQQKSIVPQLQVILEKNQAVNMLKIDATAICTDIENTNAGKAFGVRVFNDLLGARKIISDEYICFGDSPSDLEMLDELKKQGKRALLIYVGNREDIGNSVSVNDSIVFTDQKADVGTLQYLQSSEI